MKIRKTQSYVFWGLIVLSLFVIFFLGKKYDSQTQTTSWEIRTDAVQDFRLGLDIAGGVRLYYRLDLSEYEANYPNPIEFRQEKQGVIQRMRQQIDERISSLGVSDYSAYPQTLEGEDYLVIEIGGVTDLEQAKAIIGKTVELEFKLRNESDEDDAEVIAIRQAMAEDMFATVLNDPAQFDIVGQNKSSDDIYFNEYEEVLFEQLPQVYQDNLGVIMRVGTGVVVPQLFDDIYAVTQGSFGGEAQELRGFTIIKVVDVKTEDRDAILPQDIARVAQSYGLNVSQELAETDNGLGLNNYTYQTASNRVVHNGGVIFADQVAYNAKIYEVSKDEVLGKETEEVAAINSGHVNLVSGIEQIIKNGNEPSQAITSGMVTVMYDDWVSEEQLSQVVTSFESLTGAGVYTYQEASATYIVVVSDIKDTNDQLYQMSVIEGVSPSVYESLIEDLETQTLYTVQDIFMRDMNTWVTARDSKTNSVLNGAFFQKAVVDRDQTGEPVVRIDFDQEWGRIFCNLTQENRGRQMAIYVGGEQMTAPTINDAICGGSAIINGWFTIDTAQETVNNINEGALPAPMILSFEEQVSPTLGKNALIGALWAALIGLIVIFAFMTSWYGIKKGFVSFVVLIAYMVILAAFIKLIDYALSLSGLAAIILSIGMGVDATILIFERVREELQSGKKIATAIGIGYERSRLPIRDGQLSTGLIAVVLFFVGTTIFRGFGLMMMITIILLLLVAVPLTRDLLHWVFRTKRDYLSDK